MALRAMVMVLLLCTACGAGGGTGGTGGGAAATGGGAGGGGGSSGGAGGGGAQGLQGDACDSQRVIALTAQGGVYRGSAISDNSLATPSVTPTCAQKSRDVVFKLELPVAGSLHLTATPHGGGTSTAHFDPVITVFTGASCVQATDFACQDTGAIDAAESLVRQMPAGPIWVWISSADPAETGGEFDLTVLLD